MFIQRSITTISSQQNRKKAHHLRRPGAAPLLLCFDTKAFIITILTIIHIIQTIPITSTTFTIIPILLKRPPIPTVITGVMQPIRSCKDIAIAMEGIPMLIAMARAPTRMPTATVHAHTVPSLKMIAVKVELDLKP
jgi:hypothetical protein